MQELLQPGQIALASLASMLAFLMGFVIRRGSVCAVVASHQWVVQDRTQRIRAMLVASAAAGAVLLPLVWIFPDHAGLGFAFPVTLTTFVAAAAFAAGARINNGCAFGTLARLSGGDLPYIATVVGMVAGAIFIQSTRGKPTDGNASVLIEPSLIALLLWGVMVLVALPAMRQRHLAIMIKAFRPGPRILRPFTAMLVIGIVGALLYSLAGSWTYLALLEKQAMQLSSGEAAMASPKSTIGAIALLAGAVFAALRSGRFRFRLGAPTAWVRCLVGGGLMGMGAATIPGGNGVLTVFAVPSGAPNAIIALALILGLLGLSFIPERRRRARTRPTTIANRQQ